MWGMNRVMAFVSSRDASFGDDDLAFDKRPVASASRAASLGAEKLDSKAGGVSGSEQVVLTTQDSQEQVKK